VPPQGETGVRGATEVERERRVAGDVFFKKGHMLFDWRRTASMAASSISKVLGESGGFRTVRRYSIGTEIGMKFVGEEGRVEMG
jgi:hypothetical protein